jgi:iron(III) transport system substrate-binding protein
MQKKIRVQQLIISMFAILLTDIIFFTELAVTDESLTVLCGMQEDWCQGALQKFQSTTGIKSSMVRMSSGEAVSRLRAEKKNPSFDVWYGGPSLGPIAADAEGLIEAYIPKNGKAIDWRLKNSKGIWTGIYIGILGFCSNKELLDDLNTHPPGSWRDLLNPVFENNIAMADLRTSGTAVIAGSVLVAVYGGEDQAIDYLKKLHTNMFQYTKSGSSPGRMAVAGEVATAIIFSHDCVKFSKETGVDLAVSFPSEGTGYEVGQVSLIAWAKHPRKAKRFIEWTLTPKAQELGAIAGNYQIPTHPQAQIPIEAAIIEDIVFAKKFTPKLVGQLRVNGFPKRFATEVRDGKKIR